MTSFLCELGAVDEAIKSHEAEGDRWFETITAERSGNLEGELAALTLEERESQQQMSVLLDYLSKPIKRVEAEPTNIHHWLSAEGKTHILQWISYAVAISLKSR